MLNTKPNRLCSLSTGFPILSTAASTRLSYFTPTFGYERGNTLLKFFLNYNITEKLTEFNQNITARKMTVISNLTAICQFGPAAYSSISTQYEQYSTGTQNLNNTGDYISCFSARANPLMPANMDAFRDIQLWLHWIVVTCEDEVYSRIPSTCQKTHVMRLSSEQYGIFTYLKEPTDKDNPIVVSTMKSSLLLPGEVFFLNATANNSFVHSASIYGSNSSTGPNLDLNLMYDMCRTDEGYWQVRLRNISASSENDSFFDLMAAAMYRDIGGFVALADILTVNIGTYVGMYHYNVTAIESDPLWCNGNNVVSRSPLFKDFQVVTN
jgi:hypothetical protein